jgi:hypothetical protein
MIGSPCLFFYQKAQFFTGPSIIDLGCANLGNNRYIDANRQLIKIVAEKFSNSTFDPIALNSPTNLATDSQSKTSEAVRSMQNDNDKVGRMATFSPLANPLKIARFPQMTRLRKRIEAATHVWSIWSELLRPTYDDHEPADAE